MRRVAVLLAVLVVVAAMVAGCAGSKAGQTTMTTVAATTTAVAPTTTILSSFYTTYTGKGPKVIDLGSEPESKHYIIHLVCTGTDMESIVKMLDASGQEASFAPRFTMTGPGVSSYDGRVLAPPEVVRLQLDKADAWTVEVQPVSAALPFPAPGTVNGTGDEVFALPGSPLSINITATASPRGQWNKFVLEYLPEGDPFSHYIGDASMLESDYDTRGVVLGPGLLCVSAQSVDYRLTSDTASSLSTTSSSTTKPSDPKGWKRIQAGGISLALPSSFVGGAFDGPEVKALLDRGAITQEWLDRLTGASVDTDWLLLMFATGTPEPPPYVVVSRFQDDESAQSYVSGLLGDEWPSEAKLEAQNLGPDRELLKVTMPLSDGDTATRQLLLVSTGGYLYRLNFIAESAGAWSAVQAVFAESIAGVVVEKQ